MSTILYDEFGLLRHLVEVARDAHSTDLLVEGSVRVHVSNSDDSNLNLTRAVDHCSNVNGCMLLHKLVSKLRVL